MAFVNGADSSPTCHVRSMTGERATLSDQTLVTQLLTPRQVECAKLAAKGMSSKEIARELNISPSTVDSHIALALVRYNLKKRSEISSIFFDYDNKFSDQNNDSDVILLNIPLTS